MRGMRRTPAGCRTTRRRLQRWVDDECAPDDVWAVARHLARCEDCFRDADAWRRVKQAVAGLACRADGTAVERLRCVAPWDEREA